MLLRCRCSRSCCCYAVAPAIAPDVAPMSLLLSIRCRSCCCSAAASINPLHLMSLLLWLRCRSCYCSFCRSSVIPAVALLSLHCPSAIAALSVHCRSVVAPLLLLSILLSPLLSLLLSLLLLLGLFMVVASRGRIRVIVAIGDCQARVSSCL